MLKYERITSTQNVRIKHVLRLRQRRGRDRQNRILIDGVREIERAVQGGVQFHELFIGESYWQAHGGLPWSAALTPETQFLLLPDALLDRISYGERHEGLVAVAAPPELSLDQLSLSPSPLVAILEGVEKPGNVGAVVRTADAAGVDAVIVVDGITDLFNPNAIRASLGTLFSLPVCSATGEQVLAWLDQSGLNVIVARVDGACWYDQCDYQSGTAIVLGSEATGVSNRWKLDRFASAKLPMRGVADSLNVSATAAVMFYEANRQRRAAGETAPCHR